MPTIRHRVCKEESKIGPFHVVLNTEKMKKQSKTEEKTKWWKEISLSYQIH